MKVKHLEKAILVESDEIVLNEKKISEMLSSFLSNALENLKIPSPWDVDDLTEKVTHSAVTVKDGAHPPSNL